MNLNFPINIKYSEKYFDKTFEYRNITVTKPLFEIMPKNRLLTEFECLSLGVKQSRGWEHYAIHKMEPHILMFRRPLGYETLNPYK